MDWLKYIDHTADEGIIVTAPDLETLFARAATGMFTILTDINSVRETQQVEIRLQAGDLEELMVKWLSELNFRLQDEGVLFRSFNVREVSPTRLLAEASGEQVDPDRHELYTEIKAVTYHELEVEKKDNNWQAKVIFDI
jgi:SHS2 domain-containing protein